MVDDDHKVAGILSNYSDVMGAYRRELLGSIREVSDLAPGAGAFEVMVTAGSQAAGRELRAVGLPKEDAIVTSIARGGEVVLPSGDTVLSAGDRLSLIGGGEGLDKIGEVTALF